MVRIGGVAALAPELGLPGWAPAEASLAPGQRKARFGARSGAILFLLANDSDCVAVQAACRQIISCGRAASSLTKSPCSASLRSGEKPEWVMRPGDADDESVD